MPKDPLEYLLALQRILSLVLGGAFLGICGVIVFLTAGEINSYLILLLLTFVFLSCILALINFWWVSTITKDMLTLNEADSVVLRSLVMASILTLLFVLGQANELNWGWVLGLTIGYILYFIWQKS